MAFWFLNVVSLVGLSIFAAILIKGQMNSEEGKQVDKLRIWIIAIWIAGGLFAFVQIVRGEDGPFYPGIEITAVLTSWALFGSLRLRQRLGRVLLIAVPATLSELILGLLTESMLMARLNGTICLCAGLSWFALTVYESADLRRIFKQRSKWVFELPVLALLFLVGSVTNNYALGLVAAIAGIICLTVLMAKLPHFGRWVDGEWGAPADN